MDRVFLLFAGSIRKLVYMISPKNIAALATIGLLIFACKKTDKTTGGVEPPKARTSEIIYEGEKLGLESVLVKDFGANAGEYDGQKMELVFLSEGMFAFEMDGKVDSISGDGLVTSVLLYSSKANSPGAGNYAYNPTNGVLLSYNKAYVEAYINGVPVPDSKEFIHTGLVKISGDSTGYEMTANFLNDDKRNVELYYKGRAEYFNYK